MKYRHAGHIHEFVSHRHDRANEGFILLFEIQHFFVMQPMVF
jgi:hypothetical protein